MGLFTFAAWDFLRHFLPKAQAGQMCAAPLEFLRVESTETPFYEHYHQILIPVAALIEKPVAGITVTTSAVDSDSFNEEEFQRFLQSSGLKRSNLIAHSHELHLTQGQLVQIGLGQTVEIRVISKAGNFVHNFFVQAPPSALSAVKRKLKK